MLTKLFTKIQYSLEQQLFGVCEKIGEKLGMKTSKVRLSFIYLSFLTFGSPVIVYLILAFWLEHRNFETRKRKSIWEL